MMSPRENRRSSRPYETTPTMPPTATAVVSSPNPTGPMPSRSLAYRTSTDQAAPNVTLNVKIVRASVRIGGCASSHWMPSRISDRRLVRGRTSRRVLMTTRDTRIAPNTKQTAFVANGRAMPVANRNAPIGGATS